MFIDTVIFDLDGTLLDTLEDLMDSTNYALKQFHMPERTLDEIRAFVGNGVKLLIERAVEEKTDEVTCEEVLRVFKKHYLENGRNKTKLYGGIDELIDTLKVMGLKIAVVSNKIDESVKELCEYYMHGKIDSAIGDRAGVPKKPERNLVDIALSELGKTTDTAVFVGDSDVDINTARNLGIPCISVSWGFRSEEFLLSSGAKYMASTPDEVIDFIKMLGENK